MKCTRNHSAEFNARARLRPIRERPVGPLSVSRHAVRASAAKQVRKHGGVHGEAPSCTEISAPRVSAVSLLRSGRNGNRGAATSPLRVQIQL